MEVTSPKVLRSILNQTFMLVGNCAKDQHLTKLFLIYSHYFMGNGQEKLKVEENLRAQASKHR